MGEAVPAAELESRLEVALARLLKQVGGPPLVPQYELVVPGGVGVRLDFADPGRRLAIEADGRRWHATKPDFERDLRRSRAVAAAGWDLYRFGWTDVHERRTTTVAELRRLLLDPARAA